MPSLALRSVLLLALLATAGCGSKTTSLDDYRLREVILPNGTKVMAEQMIRPEDMERGMMFRKSLAPDRGMLFFHTQPGKYPYWMYQVQIPLDIIWMDDDRNIVEISADTPPCPPAATECPVYGGHQTARYVLELAGGMAKKYGLKVGDRISF